VNAADLQDHAVYRLSRRVEHGKPDRRKLRGHTADTHPDIEAGTLFVAGEETVQTADFGDGLACHTHQRILNGPNYLSFVVRVSRWTGALDERVKIDVVPGFGEATKREADTAFVAEILLALEPAALDWHSFRRLREELRIDADDVLAECERRGVVPTAELAMGVVRDLYLGGAP
jgi:hypothetical protein